MTAMIALEDMDLADRKMALLGLVGRWDEFADSLSCDPFFTDDRILNTLTAAAAPYTHPLLGSQERTDALLNLRSAVTARTEYEVRGYLPDTIDSLIGDSYDSEYVEGLLDRDVDLAIFPLLTAAPSPCVECVRTKCDVTFWQPTAPASVRCSAHRLVSL